MQTKVGGDSEVDREVGARVVTPATAAVERRLGDERAESIKTQPRRREQNKRYTHLRQQRAELEDGDTDESVDRQAAYPAIQRTCTQDAKTSADKLKRWKKYAGYRNPAVTVLLV